MADAGTDSPQAVAVACAAWGFDAYDQGMHEVPVTLPGADLVEAGIGDLAANRESEASLVVAMAAPRLRRLGLAVPDGGGERPSHRLYELLSEQDQGAAHSRYNALLARVASFSRAAEHAPTG
jgi:hypothetical protein